MSKNSAWLRNQKPGTFSLLPYAVSRSAFLDSYEKNIWCYLSTHDEDFHPSEALIAKHTGITKKWVREIINRLIRKNVIEIVNLPKRPGKKKIYRLIEPEHWDDSIPSSKNTQLPKEEVQQTPSSHQESEVQWAPSLSQNEVQRTLLKESNGPCIEKQKENYLVENQEIVDRKSHRTINTPDVNLQFRKDVANILNRSKDIDSITSDLSSLIKNYTSRNGKSPLEVAWLLRKFEWCSTQMNVQTLVKEHLRWSLVNSSNEGVAEYELKSGSDSF